MPTKKTSVDLTYLIQQEIQANDGFISFAAFMAKALYTPSLGYYANNAEKFGKNGDFITAPETSALFGACLAQTIVSLPYKNILEIGAGSGKLAKDLLLTLEKENTLPDNYFIFEISDALKIRQQAFLKETCPHLLTRITWLSALPKHFDGIIIANEVMDALPFSCFEIKDNHIYERGVGLAQTNFVWKLQEPLPALKNKILALQQHYDLSENYISEVRLTLSDWILSLAKLLETGVILLFDYGYGEREYFHPARSSGTLTCFYQHQKNTDPFIHVGSQDITAHVNFTDVVEYATQAGLDFKGYTTQAAFLLENNLLSIAEQKSLSETERFQQNQAIKTLTLPTEMGEVIKVMALSKNHLDPVLGFKLSDRSREL